MEALEKGYDVEVDIWKSNEKMAFGHDAPVCIIKDINEFLPFSKRLWFHCKNTEALEELHKKTDFMYFWHQNDCYTITSNGYFWTFPGMEILKNSIICLPEIGVYTKEMLVNCQGICSNYIEKYKAI
jgi:hypothetical protein